MSHCFCFPRFDADHDGKLTETEFRAFLLELAKSRVLPHKIRSRKDVQDATALVPTASSTATSTGDGKPEVTSLSPVTSTDAQVLTPSSGTPGSCPELTKELIASFALNGTIMLTVCDWRIFETFGECGLSIMLTEF